MQENARKWKKMQENERKWKKMKENERKWKKMKENERKWKKMKENMSLSFSVDGWSDRAERWVKARFWRCWQRAVGPTRVTD